VHFGHLVGLVSFKSCGEDPKHIDILVSSCGKEIPFSVMRHILSSTLIRLASLPPTQTFVLEIHNPPPPGKKKKKLYVKF